MSVCFSISLTFSLKVSVVWNFSIDQFIDFSPKIERMLPFLYSSSVILPDTDLISLTTCSSRRASAPLFCFFLRLFWTSFSFPSTLSASAASFFSWSVGDLTYLRLIGKSTDSQEVTEEVAETDVAERKEALDDDVDAILDEIDEVLEANAEDFVKSFIQKGGE